MNVEESAPVVEEAPPVAGVVEKEAPPQTPEAEDAALESAIEEQAIDIPDGEKLVPLSAVTNLRGKIKEVRSQLADASTKASKADRLEARLQQLQQQVEQMTPYVQAYQQLQQQPAKTEATPEDVSELKEIAEDLDLYKDGALDLDRARRVRDRQEKLAEKVARQQVEPMHRQNTQQASRAFLQQAKVTTAPSGMKADPAVLEAVWANLDPAVTSTKEGAIQAFNVALGYTAAMQKPAAAAAKEAVPPPLFTEKAGGRAGGSVTLTDGDRRAARELGMTDAEYAKEAAKMPWGQR